MNSIHHSKFTIQNSEFFFNKDPMSLTYYTPTQADAIDRDNRQMAAIDLPMSGELDDIRSLIAAGSIGIQSAAKDVDSLTLGGGHFTVDPLLTTGLTFALQAGRVRWTNTIVSSAAQSVALSASSVNYVEVDTTGTVYTNTAGFTAGRVPLYLVTTGVSAIATIVNSKPLITAVSPGSVTGSLLSTTAATRVINKDVADVSATTSFCIIAPVSGTLIKMSIANKSAFATSDTNNWGFGLVNQSNATVAMLASGAGVNTTAATGGAALAAYTRRVLTLSGTSANLNVNEGDVLEFTVTKTGAPADLLEFASRFDFSFAG